jgi:Concanavalin A-like lectin/glucanases superfamily
VSPHAGGRYAKQQGAGGGGGGFDATAWGTVLGEYDFSDTSKITQSGGLVSSVAVKSGTWPSVVQPSGSAQPVTGTRTQNALNVLDFDGASDYLYISAQSGAQPLTVVVAAASDNVDAAMHEVTGYQPELYVEGDVWKFKSSTVVASATPEDSGFHILVGIFNGPSSELWIDGVKVLGPVSAGTLGYVDVYIGCGLSTYWNGTVGHKIVYSGVVANPAGLSSALMSKWGVVAAFDPGTISNMLGWWDFSNTASITHSAGRVSSVADKGPVNKPQTQATGAFQPMTGTRTINGRNTIDFDSANTFLRTTNYINSPPYTLFAVAKMDTLPAAADRQLLGNSNQNPTIYSTPNAGTGYWSYFSGTQQQSAVAIDLNPHMASAVFNGASSSFYLDGTLISSGNPGAGNYNDYPVAIGNNPVNALSWWDGIVGEVIVYNKALTTIERQNVEGYLKAKWGTP